MNSQPVDYSNFVGAPIINVANGIALARALLAAMPKSSPPSLRKAARRLHKSAAALQDAWAGRAGGERARDPRPVDQAMDGATSALHQRLMAYASLPPDVFPRARDAMDLAKQLFPNGLSFLRLPYAEEWAEIGQLLKRIDDGSLGGAIDRLCGPEFLENLRGRYEEYGVALGITRPTGPAAATTPLAEPLRALARSIGNFTVHAAACAEDLTEEEAAALFRPVEAHRAAAAARRSRGETNGSDEPGPSPDPAEPLPDVPPGA